jgi:hypothetical protein
MGMKVLICGDRYWTGRLPIRSWLCKLQDWAYDTVIEGEAPGADSIAREEAEQMGFKVLKYPAEWGRYGRAAGPIRNRQMLDEKPDLVLAFHADLSRSRGTRDTVEEARRRGIMTIVVPG